MAIMIFQNIYFHDIGLFCNFKVYVLKLGVVFLKYRVLTLIMKKINTAVAQQSGIEFVIQTTEFDAHHLLYRIFSHNFPKFKTVSFFKCLQTKNFRNEPTTRE